MINYLNWPQVPKDLELLVLNYINKTDLANTYDNYPIDESNINWSDSIGCSLFNIDREKYNPAEFIFLLDVPTELKNWVTENISGQYDITSIQIMTGGTQILPHIDGYRNIAYNYIISASPETTTCFYTPIEKFKDHKFYPETYIPYNRLILTEEHHILPNVWHKLDVQKIHSVENINIEIPRIAITLSVK
jgi:hypothetical protein